MFRILCGAAFKVRSIAVFIATKQTNYRARRQPQVDWGSYNELIRPALELQAALNEVFPSPL